MRRTGSLLAAAAFAFSLGGCLSSIIPEHQASTGTDGGMGTGTGTGTGNGTGGGMGNGTGGGMGNGTGGGMANGTGMPDMAIANDPNCINAATPTIDGHHNAGLACLTCHDGNTAGANKFTAGGTIYDIQQTPPVPVSGATIELVDAAGTKVTVVTASTGAPGNFWTDVALVYPVTVRASKCPFDRPMPTKLAAGATPAQGDGNCSRAGCHDTNNLMHMP
jgi:hypothetical protein